MMDADAFAFFQSTIGYFIDFKAKKNSPDWIWERVRNNVKRLRPQFRSAACQSVRSLPPETLSKVTVDWKELTHLCAPSGLHSECVSEVFDDADSVHSVHTDHTTPRSSSVEIKTNHLECCHSDEDHEFVVDDVAHLGSLKVMESANSASSACSIGVLH